MGSSTLGRLDLEGLFDILVLQLYSVVDHFGLKDCGEVFTPSTSVFLFDNTLRCYLCLHLSSLTSCVFLLLVYYVCLCIDYSYSALS